MIARRSSFGRSPKIGDLACYDSDSYPYIVWTDTDRLAAGFLGGPSDATYSGAIQAWARVSNSGDE